MSQWLKTPYYNLNIFIKYGTMEITCHQTGYKAILNFKPYSWSNKELNKVEGHIFDKKYNSIIFIRIVFMSEPV